MIQSTKVRCGASLPHAEADAPTRSAPPAEEKEFQFVQVSELASYTGIQPEQIVEYFDDGVYENRNEIDFFKDWCKDESLDKRPPPNGTKYGHIIIYGDRNPMTWDHGKSGDIPLYDLESGDWIAVEYRT